MDSDEIGLIVSSMVLGFLAGLICSAIGYFLWTNFEIVAK